MSAKYQAFIPVTAKCPICGTDSQHRYIKSKMVSPLEVEDDLHVVAYKWESPEFEHIRPNFYHIWHCPHCQFCEEKEVFRGEDQSGGKLELIQEKILILQRNTKGFLSIVGGMVDLQNEPVQVNTALLAHLQAIYIQQMLSPNNRQFAKLARFYLRTAWLYREWSQLEDVVPSDPPQGFTSWELVLEKLAVLWPELPLNEETSLRLAIENYQRDLDNSNALDDIRHDVGVMFVLVSLYMRLGGLDDALKYVRFIFQRCTQKRQESRHTLEKGVSLGKLNGQQIEQLRNLVNWLNNTIDRCTELSEKVNAKIFEKEFPAARDVVLSLAEPTAELIAEQLRNQSFHEITIRKLVALFNRQLAEKQGKTQGGAAAPAPSPTAPQPQSSSPSSTSSADTGTVAKPEAKGFWNRLKGGN